MMDPDQDMQIEREMWEEEQYRRAMEEEYEEAYTEEMSGTEECVNCGDRYTPGEGAPQGKYECCCSEACWIEFNGGAPGKDKVVMVELNPEGRDSE